VIPLWDGQSHKTLVPFTSDHTTPPPPSLPGRYYTAADYHALYLAGTITPVDVVTALLPLTRRGLENAKFETMFVDAHGLGDDIVLAAAQASTDRYKAGTPLGPLDGVPFAVKDDTAVAGWVSHHGMRYDPKQKCFEPKTETVGHVKRLEEAGAIMVAKTNMHELGCGECGLWPVVLKVLFVLSLTKRMNDGRHFWMQCK
jgi:Asp-tRNA(Asn)/Glu-tRNA(Gln) amidotransferase A subunit family amidase